MDPTFWLRIVAAGMFAFLFENDFVMNRFALELMIQLSTGCAAGLFIPAVHVKETRISGFRV